MAIPGSTPTPSPAPGGPPVGRHFRRHLLLSGLLGLLACAGLAALCLVIARSGRTPSILSAFPLIVALLALMMGAFSVAEIPLMVFAMRRLAIERRDNLKLVLGLNALFVFFAGVYAVLVLLLASSPGWGLALAALALIRLGASAWFVRPPDIDSTAEHPRP